MKRFLTLFLSLAAFSSADPVVGKIGDIEIKADEIREALAGLEASREITSDPAALGQFVRALLIQRLVLKEALDQKWDQKPEVIAQLVRARETALTESYLQAVSAPDPSFPAEAELQAAYETAKPSLAVPRTYRLAQIFISSPKDADEETAAKAKARLDQTVKQLSEKSADFSSIARTTSDEAASAKQGGEIGWLQENQIQPEIAGILPTLTTGGISSPVRLEDGWHILKLLDLREPHTPPLRDVRAALTARLRAEQSQLNRQRHLAELLKEHPLAINEIELSKARPAPVE